MYYEKKKRQEAHGIGALKFPPLGTVTSKTAVPHLFSFPPYYALKG